MTQNIEEVTICSLVFDGQGNYISTLPSVNNFQKSTQSVQQVVKVIYENYLQATASQVRTVCKVFLATPQNKDIEWEENFVGHVMGHDAITKRVKSYLLLTTLYESYGDGKIIESYG